MKPREIAKAPPNHAVEHVQCHGVQGGWIAAHAVKHTSKPSTRPQEPESDLGVVEFPKGVQQIAGRGGSLGSVGADKSFITESITKKSR